MDYIQNEMENKYLADRQSYFFNKKHCKTLYVHISYQFYDI